MRLAKLAAKILLILIVISYVVIAAALPDFLSIDSSFIIFCVSVLFGGFCALCLIWPLIKIILGINHLEIWHKNFDTKFKDLEK